MERNPFTSYRKPYEKTDISERKKTSVVPINKYKPKFCIIKQACLIILIILNFSLYISISKSSKIQQKNISSLIALITSLKRESQFLRSQTNADENLLQNKNQKQNLSHFDKNQSSSEFTKLLSSLHELKQKVQKPKTITELGILISFLTAPRSVVGRKKVRVGNNADGGYILLNDFSDIKIAYSLGISNYIEFDKGLADKGIDVYMYDHTINSLPYNNAKFHWFKKGLCGNNNRKKNLMTLNEMLEQNGHLNESNMLLKIDVEGAEWEAYNELSEKILSKFKYIIGEFH